MSAHLSLGSRLAEHIYNALNLGSVVAEALLDGVNVLRVIQACKLNHIMQSAKIRTVCINPFAA